MEHLFNERKTYITTMNKDILKLLIFLFLPSVASAALVEYKTDKGGIWSESSTWLINPDQTYPQSTSHAAVGNQPNGAVLTVDGNYTIGAYYTGYSAKLLTMNINDGCSLTIDSKEDTNKSPIIMWSGGTNRVIDDILNINGGSLKFTDTSSLGNSTLNVVMSRNNPDGFFKIINFNTALSSTEHLKFTGYKTVNTIANINNGINATNGSDTKNITLSAATVSLGGNSNIGSLSLTNSSIITINEGATLNTSPTTPLVASDKTKFANEINADSKMILNGSLIVNTIASTDSFRNSGTLIVGKNGSLKVSGSGWNNFNLYKNAVLDISSGKNSFIVTGGLRMDNNSTLILRNSNAINIEDSDTNNTIIQLGVSEGNFRIELYADNHFGTFAFATKSTLTVLLGQGCNEFLLNDLSGDYQGGSWLGKLVDKDSNIIFEDFRNNVVKVTNYDNITQDDLDRISAAGFKDFFVSENGYINAYAIPEVSTMALILSIIAMGVVLAKRSRCNRAL